MKIPDTTIEVDDFRPAGASLYVLTHYHADHRRGLRSGESRPVLCSSVTRRLLLNLNGAALNAIRTIDPGERLSLPDGITVRAYDAHHCPGALMLLFERGAKRYLHTGDFRYTAEHDLHPELFDGIDTLFLDRTYAPAGGETWEHPTQEEAIEEVLEIIRAHPGRQIFLGIYTIGKNRIVEAIFDRLGLKVHMSAKYCLVHRLLGLERCVTRNAAETRISARPMGYFRSSFQRDFRGREGESLVILPTGWKEGRGQGSNYRYVPYSEHNSSSELERFVKRVGACRVVETNDFF